MFELEVEMEVELEVQALCVETNKGGIWREFALKGIRRLCNLIINLLLIGKFLI